MKNLLNKIYLKIKIFLRLKAQIIYLKKIIILIILYINNKI
jgi:hypothetical protein